jgi:Myb-like DNA-binding domain
LSGSLLPAVGLPPTAIPAKRGAETPHQASPPQKKHHGKWTEEEDNLAIELRRRGMKWEDISKRIPGRSAISCRLRYQNYSEKRPNWDEEKKNKLARLYNR